MHFQHQLKENRVQMVHLVELKEYRLNADEITRERSIPIIQYTGADSLANMEIIPLIELKKEL